MRRETQWYYLVERKIVQNFNTSHNLSQRIRETFRNYVHLLALRITIKITLLLMICWWWRFIQSKPNTDRNLIEFDDLSHRITSIRIFFFCRCCLYSCCYCWLLPTVHHNTSSIHSIHGQRIFIHFISFVCHFVINWMLGWINNLGHIVSILQLNSYARSNSRKMKRGQN